MTFILKQIIFVKVTFILKQKVYVLVLLISVNLCFLAYKLGRREY